MHAAADRPEFAPPAPPGLLGGLVIAVLAHLLLMAALTWGIRWNRDTTEAVMQAEIWSPVVQEQAPKEVVAPPPPPPPPVAREEPKPPPRQDTDIAEKREKERREAARREAEERRELAEKRAREREQAEKREREQEKLAEQKRRQDEARRKKQDEERVAKLREENIRRMQGLAGGSDAPSARGTAVASAGPSASWAGRVRARVKPNIVFADNVTGNPEAVILVRLAPDGTIVGKRVVKSSGNSGWDDAVMRALDKTEVFPRQEDGRVPPSVELAFRPKD